jgi:hypothetical protein
MPRRPRSIAPSPAAAAAAMSAVAYRGPRPPSLSQDGYAVVSSDGPGEYDVAFEAFAGVAPATLSPGSVAYIGTGGPLPEGADAGAPRSAASAGAPARLPSCHAWHAYSWGGGGGGAPGPPGAPPPPAPAGAPPRRPPPPPGPGAGGGGGGGGGHRQPLGPGRASRSRAAPSAADMACFLGLPRRQQRQPSFPQQEVATVSACNPPRSGANRGHRVFGAGRRRRQARAHQKGGAPGLRRAAGAACRGRRGGGGDGQGGGGWRAGGRACSSLVALMALAARAFPPVHAKAPTLTPLALPSLQHTKNIDAPPPPPHPLAHHHHHTHIHIHMRVSPQVGSDMAAGETVLRAGHRVGAAEVGILATVGATTVR